MIDPKLEKQIEQQLAKIPEDIGQAIIAVDFPEKMRAVYSRQHLLIDQVGALETETILVLIGLEPLKDFVFNIEKNLSVSIMRAKEIAYDIDQNIFKPIRQSLQLLQNDTVNETAEQIAPEKFDRETILKEIENPPVKSSSISIIEPIKKEAGVIELASEARFQQDPPPQTPPNKIETKMSGITITPKVIVEEKPETKLPSIEKSRPNDGIDPYREPIN